MKLTYCNPLSIPDVPAGRWLDMNISRLDERSRPDYRSMSDPSVVYHDGKWILYPSYGLAWVTEDFVHWKHVDIGIKALRYSPAVVQFKGKWYIGGHGIKELYTADSPTGPFVHCGDLTTVEGKVFSVPDGCFLADVDKDGNERLYYYWCGHVPLEEDDDVESITATLGVEMDPDKPWQAITAPVVINRFDPSREWQRHGEYNQNRRMGWVEGQWMIKKNGRYYLLYSGSGTQFSSYACGVAYSDEGPLSGFVNQKNHDPLTEKRHGVMRGAGHGCIAEG
nr:family 43 glycosylhydrolase [Clostridia bacterium]